MLPSRSVADTTVPAVGDRLARVGMRAVLLVGLAAVLLALSGGPAEAHAALVAADPAAGQRLATAPGLVVLRFTEPLNTRLSGVTVTDPAGQRFWGGAVGPEELRVRLFTNAPGVYRVAWATVSVVDGHSLRGGFAFGMGVAVGGPAGEGVVTGARGRDVLVAAGRGVEDAALLSVLGMLLLVGLARRDPPLAQALVRPPVALALVVAFAGGLTVVVAEAVAATSTLAAGGSVSVGGMVIYLTSGVPGWARLGRVALEAVALLVALSRSGRSSWSRWEWARPGALPAVATMVVLAVVALAASGHAAGAVPGWWGVTADAAHLLGAGLWVGSWPWRRCGCSRHGNTSGGPAPRGRPWQPGSRRWRWRRSWSPRGLGWCRRSSSSGRSVRCWAPPTGGPSASRSWPLRP